MLHSASKYINGHSDLIGGVVAVRDNPALIQRLKYLQNAIGSIASPFDSYMAFNFIRLSVGIESITDLQADLDQALEGE